MLNNTLSTTIDVISSLVQKTVVIKSKVDTLLTNEDYQNLLAEIQELSGKLNNVEQPSDQEVATIYDLVVSDCGVQRLNGIYYLQDKTTTGINRVFIHYDEQTAISSKIYYTGAIDGWWLDSMIPNEDGDEDDFYLVGKTQPTLSGWAPCSAVGVNPPTVRYGTAGASTQEIPVYVEGMQRVQLTSIVSGTELDYSESQYYYVDSPQQLLIIKLKNFPNGGKMRIDLLVDYGNNTIYLNDPQTSKDIYMITNNVAQRLTYYLIVTKQNNQFNVTYTID